MIFFGRLGPGGTIIDRAKIAKAPVPAAGHVRPFHERVGQEQGQGPSAAGMAMPQIVPLKMLLYANKPGHGMPAATD